MINHFLFISISFVNLRCISHQLTLCPLVLIKNDPRFPILFHSLGPGNVQEVSKLNLTLFNPGSVVTLLFFFFFYKEKKKSRFSEWRWQLLGNVTVADKKEKGLKATATKLQQCFGAQENLFFQEGNRNTFLFSFFDNCVFPLMRSLSDLYSERLLFA